jgi:uncharacterized protein YjdB
MSCRWDVGYRYAAPLLTLAALTLSGCTDQAAGPGRSIASIEVLPSEIVIDADTPFVAKAVVKDQLGQPFAQLPDRVKIVWSTRDPDIATVDQSGTITPISTGSTRVIASIDYVLPQGDLVPMGKGNGNGQGNTGGSGGGPKDSAGVHVQRVPSSLAVVSGDGQSAKISSTLAQPLTVQALDRKGHAIPGAVIGFSVVQGGGSITPTSATTDASGLASASWTMGTAAGAAAATAITQQGSATATFSATALAGDPARLVVVAGNDQSAAPSTELPVPLKVQLTDLMGNAVPGQTIKWQIMSGGGAVSPASATTASDGTAGTNWTLGSSTGQQEASASTAGLSSTLFTAMASSTTLPSCISLASTVDTLNYLGEAKQLTATVPAGSIVTWSSSNAGVASVDLFGKVTAAAKGVAVITATVAGCAPATASVAVRQLAATVAVTPSSASLSTGGSKQLQAAASDSGGTAIAGLLFSWSSTDTAVANVDQTGLVLARSAGSATIAAAAGAGVGKAAITVTGLSTPIACISISPAVDTLNYIGETTQMKDSTGASATVSWASSNSSVAAVDAGGKVTGKGKGSATITATVSGCASASSAVAVRQVAAAVAVSPATSSLSAGATQQFQASATDSGGVAIAGSSFSWSSSNTAVATVTQAGLATAVASGTATIRATDGAVSKTATLTVSAPVSASHAGFYTSPTGTPSGTGSQSQPWDLATAFAGGNGKIQPGDTVWLLGGHYAGDFHETVSGTSAAPVIFRQYPGQRATVDGRLEGSGNYVWYWGFEAMYSDPQRVSSQTGPWPTDIPRQYRQVYIDGSGDRLINMVMHDLGEVAVQDGAGNTVYGSLSYNNGWTAPDRGHGHGLYIQNDGPQATVENNVIFNNFGKGIQAYGSANPVDNMVFRGNAAFMAGSLAGDQDIDFLVGGAQYGSYSIVFTGNFSYQTQDGTGQRFGYGPLNRDIDLSGNYFVGYTDVNNWSSVRLTGTTVVGWNTIVALERPSGATATWNGNTYFSRELQYQPFGFSGAGYSFPGWQTATGYDGSSSYTHGSPTGTKVVVEPNAYEAGRANIVVYNWSGLASVSADLSQVLKPGQGYEVRNAEDYFAAPVASGTYGGGLISLPMTGLSVAQPIGNAPYPAPATAPTFAVFIVVPTTP